MAEKGIKIKGPYFEDFEVGKYLEDPPSITITTGYVAFHQALFGDRLRLPLDAHLCKNITGSETPLVNPSLLCNTAIGQTTYASQKVKANLFYRGLIIKNPVFVNDTLYTKTKVIALKQNSIKPGRTSTGLVVLEIEVRNQHGEEVILFWRCPMIPCRDPNANTGHADSLDVAPPQINIENVKSAVPKDWNYRQFKKEISGEHFDQISESVTYEIESRDTVTSAPELARLTLNMAAIHFDSRSSVYHKRLIFGGHTIAMAGAQLSRALPNIVTLMAWRRCDHVAPVFEGDILQSKVNITKKYPLEDIGGLVDLQIDVCAERGESNPDAGQKDIKVLDWEVIALMA